MCGRCVEDCCVSRDIVSVAKVVCTTRRGGLMVTNVSRLGDVVPGAVVLMATVPMLSCRGIIQHINRITLPLHIQEVLLHRDNQPNQMLHI